MRQHARGLDIGALVLGAIVVFVGAYYLLRNTLGLDLGELDWERIWPILVIGIGLSIFVGVFRGSGREEAPPSDRTLGGGQQ